MHNGLDVNGKKHTVSISQDSVNGAELPVVANLKESKFGKFILFIDL